MAVESIVFPLTAKKISGATRTSTNFQKGLSGLEVRNANWQDALRRFDVLPGIKSLTDQQTAETFFIALDGPVVGFLLQDPKDNSATHAATTLSTGVTQQGVTVALNVGRTIFQLQKSYTVGSRTRRRHITRPESGTVVLYNNSGAVITPTSIDYATGQVTFSGAQAVSPTWDGNFYVPVRFQDDEVPFDVMKQNVWSGRGHGDMPQIVLVEEREGQDLVTF